MSSDTTTLETLGTPPSSDETFPMTHWQRVTFAGVTTGSQPRVTLRVHGQTPNGSIRHSSQTIHVNDDAVLLQLTKLAAGTEIRACIETDWNTPNIEVILKSFCCIE